MAEDSLEYIGRYKVLGTLGRGSMGVVYKAQDPNIGRVVAIKTLRKTGIDESALENFKNEARSAGNLRHPNIVTVFDVNIQGDNPYIVMDLIEGQSLDLIIAERKKLRPDLVLYYLKQIASGLDAAHAKGVIHRDIKPSNIIIDASETCYIADFGVAMISAGVDEINNGNIVGTPGYMAPEQIQNKGVSPRTDLFSLAVVAFECFTGRRPFPGNNITEVLGNILNAPPLSLTSLVDLPLALEAEFEKALAKLPEERYATGEILVHKFAEAMGIYRIDKPLISHFEDSLDGEEEELWQRIPSSGSTSKEEPSNDSIEDDGETIAYTSSGPSASSYTIGAASENIEEEKVEETSPGAMFEYGDSHVIASWHKKDEINKSLLIFMIAFVIIAGAISSGIVVLSVTDESIDNTTEYVEEEVEQSESSVKTDPEGSPKEESTQEVVSWKTVSELTDDEIMTLLSNKNSSEQNVLDALDEVRKRLIYDFVEVAESLMESDNYQIRYNTLKALKVLKDKDTLPIAISALNDYDSLVRGEAANVLGALGSRKSLGALVSNYKIEEVSEVKIALKRAIEKINGYPFEG